MSDLSKCKMTGMRDITRGLFYINVDMNRCGPADQVSSNGGSKFAISLHKIILTGGPDGPIGPYGKKSKK
jgi:hypothetical protein